MDFSGGEGANMRVFHVDIGANSCTTALLSWHSSCLHTLHSLFRLTTTDLTVEAEDAHEPSPPRTFSVATVVIVSVLACIEFIIIVVLALQRCNRNQGAPSRDDTYVQMHRSK